MPHAALVAGPPRSGKTTAVRRTVETLRDDVAVGGIYCPELREDGERVGFEIVDLATGEREVMAHVDVDEGPSVGSYRVDTSAVDTVAGRAIPAAVADADCVVNDEIAPMQLTSDRFVAELRRALAADLPVVAAIADRDDRGVLADLHRRDDVDRFQVRAETRDELPGRLAEWVHRFRTEGNSPLYGE